MVSQYEDKLKTETVPQKSPVLAPQEAHPHRTPQKEAEAHPHCTSPRESETHPRTPLRESETHPCTSPRESETHVRTPPGELKEAHPCTPPIESKEARPRTHLPGLKSDFCQPEKHFKDCMHS